MLLNRFFSSCRLAISDRLRKAGKRPVHSRKLRGVELFPGRKPGGERRPVNPSPRYGGHPFRGTEQVDVLADIAGIGEDGLPPVQARGFDGG